MSIYHSDTHHFFLKLKAANCYVNVELDIFFYISLQNFHTVVVLPLHALLAFTINKCQLKK